jgi:hypothetical protein
MTRRRAGVAPAPAEGGGLALAGERGEPGEGIP